MLDSYFKHASEREAQGIPPLPLNPEQATELCELLKAPPAGKEKLSRLPTNNNARKMYKILFII